MFLVVIHQVWRWASNGMSSNIASNREADNIKVTNLRSQDTSVYEGRVKEKHALQTDGPEELDGETSLEAGPTDPKAQSVIVYKRPKKDSQDAGESADQMSTLSRPGGLSRHRSCKAPEKADESRVSSAKMRRTGSVSVSTVKDSLAAILRMEPKDRQRRQIAKLEQNFSDNAFFKEKRAELEDSTMFNLFKHLKAEEHPEGRVLFNFGDAGDLFYIVLEGGVDVCIPSPIELEQDSATPEGLISFCIMYFNEIYWDGIKHGREALQYFYNEIKELGVSVDAQGRFDQQDTFETVDRAIARGSTNIHETLYKYLNPDGATTIMMRQFKVVTTLGPGAPFGQLALYNSSGRAATCICATECTFATLSRNDYKWIIGAEERRKAKKIIEFLRNYRVFTTLRSAVIEKIYQYMKTIEFHRGQQIYREGDANVNGVYFIIEGEFQVEKFIRLIDEDTLDDNGQLTSLEQRLRKSPIKSSRVKEMLRSRSNAAISRIHSPTNFQAITKRGTAPAQAPVQNKNLVRMKAKNRQIQLYLLGKNEIFGMEEIVDLSQTRSFSVACASKIGKVYFLSRENFQDCVNQFRFSDLIVNEILLRHRLYKERVMQTHVFQQNFERSQQEQWGKVQRWAKESQRQQELQLNSPKEVTLKSVRKKNEVDRSDDQIQLNTILDKSEIMRSEFELLHPRKHDSKAIQNFKVSMLETLIKPMSWRDQKMNIAKNQEAMKAYKDSIMRSNQRINPDAIVRVTRHKVKHSIVEEQATEDTLNYTDGSIKPVRSAQIGVIESRFKQIDAKQLHINIYKNSQKILSENRLHQIFAPRLGNADHAERSKAIDAIGQSIQKISILNKEDSDYLDLLYERQEKTEKAALADKNNSSKAKTSLAPVETKQASAQNDQWVPPLRRQSTKSALSHTQLEAQKKSPGIRRSLDLQTTTKKMLQNSVGTEGSQVRTNQTIDQNHSSPEPFKAEPKFAKYPTIKRIKKADAATLENNFAKEVVIDHLKAEVPVGQSTTEEQATEQLKSISNMKTPPDGTATGLRGEIQKRLSALGDRKPSNIRKPQSRDISPFNRSVNFKKGTGDHSKTVGERSKVHFQKKVTNVTTVNELRDRSARRSTDRNSTAELEMKSNALKPAGSSERSPKRGRKTEEHWKGRMMPSHSQKSLSNRIKLPSIESDVRKVEKPQATLSYQVIPTMAEMETAKHLMPMLTARQEQTELLHHLGRSSLTAVKQQSQQKEEISPFLTKIVKMTSGSNSAGKGNLLFMQTNPVKDQYQAKPRPYQLASQGRQSPSRFAQFPNTSQSPSFLRPTEAILGPTVAKSISTRHLQQASPNTQQQASGITQMDKTKHIFQTYNDPFQNPSIPDYLTKPIVQQRQRMFGSLKTLSQATSQGRFQAMKAANLNEGDELPMMITSRSPNETGSATERQTLPAVYSARNSSADPNSKTVSMLVRNEGVLAKRKTITTTVVAKQKPIQGKPD